MSEAHAGAAGCPFAHRATGGHPRDLVVCLSHLRWDFVFQRPQHLLTRAASARDVLFVEEPVFSTHTTEPWMEVRLATEGIAVAVPHLPSGLAGDAAAAAQRALLGDLLARSGPDTRRLIGWFYTPMALEFAGGMPFDLVVYDCMDELSLFRGAPVRLLVLEQRLLALADLVFTGGRSLFDAKRDRHPRVHCFPSSIDAAHFLDARQHSLAEPPEMLALPRPRIGFFGVVDERMDLALIARLAEARPDWSLVMVGPVVKIDPASLPQSQNLYWAGGRRYVELPAWLGAWDAGFMPFALNESTRFISPTKTPEFLAAGLRVVSTPIADVVRDWGPRGAGLVDIADSAEGFVRSLEAALRDADRQAWLARVDTALDRLSWDLTWEAMALLVDDALASDRDARDIASPATFARSLP